MKIYALEIDGDWDRAVIEAFKERVGVHWTNLSEAAAALQVWLSTDHAFVRHFVSFRPEYGAYPDGHETRIDRVVVLAEGGGLGIHVSGDVRSAVRVSGKPRKRMIDGVEYTAPPEVTTTYGEWAPLERSGFVDAEEYDLRGALP